VPHHLQQDLFLEQVRHLSESNFNCISLQELADCVKKGNIPKRTIALTFDDGFYNNYSVAYPILKHYKIPASIFITTELVGADKLLWPEQLAVLLTLSPKKSVKLGIQTLRIESLDEKSTSYLQITKYFSTLTAEQIKSTITDLLNQSELSQKDIRQSDLYEPLRFMTWQEITEMKKSGLIDIGSHTMSHRRLAHLPQDEASEEIKVSKRKIEMRLKICRSFAYPHGRTDIDFREEHTQMALDAGYDILLTADPASVTKKHSTSNLPRIGILHDHTIDEFDYLLRGGAALANRKLTLNKIFHGALSGTIPA
jgi:peptidoglycan/xylan/chitin deacetylase (PgdA/CDA1 family)